MAKKRVWILYRVSDKQQLYNKDEIPQQEKTCRSFVAEKKHHTNDEWVITKEIYEKGVSGWKKSVDDREELEIIKQGAINKEYDILLVFYSDRLGRLSLEIPLMISFLNKQGIIIWSTEEGIIGAKNPDEYDHNESITTFLKFWLSEGESVKKSVVVKNAMKNLQQEGTYVGGFAPFGYEIYDTEIKHPKKDKQMKDLRINEQEAEIVNLIYDLVLLKGYGARRITQFLNEEVGIKTRFNTLWQQNVISRMLRNPLYKGIRRYDTNKGKKSNKDCKLQPFKQELVIIPESKWEKVQVIIDNRNTKRDNKEEVISLPTHSNTLLGGLAFCGYCGAKLMSANSKKKYNRKSDSDVTITNTHQYRCSTKNSRYTNIEHEQSNFGCKKYDAQFEKMILMFISKINKETFIEKEKSYKEKALKDKSKQLNKLEKEVAQKQKELDVLNKEIVKALMNKSEFSKEQLAELIEQQKQEIQEAESKVEEIKLEINDSKKINNAIVDIKNQLEDWDIKYKMADLDKKKMMLSNIIDKVNIKKNKIEIVLNLVLKELLNVNDLEVVQGS